jgi:arylsulfatase A-like enzyme
VEGTRSQRLRSLLAASAYLAAALLAGCDSPGPTAATRPSAPLFLLVSVDTLRADRLGLYGNPRETSKHLDAFAAESAVFDAAWTTAPWTLPAHASLLTGLYPVHHRVDTPGARLPENLPTLADSLRAAGFDTRASVNSHFFNEKSGLLRGFDRTHVETESTRQFGATARGVDRVLLWLAEPRKRPLFVFLHTFDAHADYLAPAMDRGTFSQDYAGPMDGVTGQLLAVRSGEESLDAGDAAHLRDLYDESLRSIDTELGRLLAALREGDPPGNTLVVITSDHGEEFFDHGDVLHGRNHRPEVVRVPLVMRHASIPAGLRIREPVSLVDVAPTALALLGLPALPGSDGRDLSPLLSGEDHEPLGERPLFVAGDHGLQPANRLASVRRGRFALHLDLDSFEVELYDLEQDPEERAALPVEGSALAADLGRELRAHLASARAAAPVRELAPHEQALLESLGYSAPRAALPSGSEEHQVLPDEDQKDPERNEDRKARSGTEAGQFEPHRQHP